MASYEACRWARGIRGARVVRGMIAMTSGSVRAALPLAIAFAPACGRDRLAESAVAPAGPREWNYFVEVAEDGRQLDIVASFAATGTGTFTVGEGAAPFVEGAKLETLSGRAVRRALERAGDSFSAPECASQPCRVHYRFATARAASELNDPDDARAYGTAYESPPSTWLLRPSSAPPDARYHVRLVGRESQTSKGAPQIRVGALEGDGVSSFSGGISDFDGAPFAAIGPWKFSTLAVSPRSSTFFTASDGARFDLAVAPVSFGMTGPEIDAWISHSAGMMANYFGAFPLPRALVLVVPGTAGHIDGTTMGGGGASILMRVGRDVPIERAKSDWVLTHELVHVCFPSLGAPHRWMEEGLATYLEPVARARVNDLDSHVFWRDLWNGLPQGLPEPGDTGLESTATWGRTYWGGALFWLLADVEIRSRTGGKASLADALRKIASDGGTVNVRWPIEKVIDESDRATGVPVLHELYARLAVSPGVTDLPSLFSRLGVTPEGNSVRFDDSAPLASVRRAITAAAEPSPAPKPAAR